MVQQIVELEKYSSILEQEIPVEDLNNGLYYLEIWMGENLITKRLVVVKTEK